MNNTLKIPAGTSYWFDRTKEQIDNLRALDAAMGQTCDSAGESKIYNVTTGRTSQEDLIVTVTKTRGVSWSSWRKKPTYLLEGITTIDGVPRIIKFRNPTRIK